MAVYNPEQPDWRLVRNGFVTLFWRAEVLDRAEGDLTALGYRVVGLDAAPWTTDADLHRDFAAALDFPDYYGHNLNALNDCLGDLTESPGAATGLVLVLHHYDAFAALRPDTAHAVLDIVADQARVAALLGHRLLCLVQSDDPDIQFAPVGATTVGWNDVEWLDAKRHP